jgi:hypothetical protein
MKITLYMLPGIGKGMGHGPWAMGHGPWAIVPLFKKNGPLNFTKPKHLL